MLRFRLPPERNPTRIYLGRSHFDGGSGGGFTLSMTPNNKSLIIEDYRTHETDTGSPEVQIALL